MFTLVVVGLCSKCNKRGDHQSVSVVSPNQLHTRRFVCVCLIWAHHCFQGVLGTNRHGGFETHNPLPSQQSVLAAIGPIVQLAVRDSDWFAQSLLVLSNV